MIAAVVLPFCGERQRTSVVRHWSAGLLEILAVRIEPTGTPPRADAATLLVANHVSWLDIFALNAVSTARFVAKAEIRRWPVVGWLAARGGTLFIERARRHKIAQVNQKVEAALRRGAAFAVFPEGSTTAGDVLLPFHASVLQPALTCDAVLQPVAIRYARADGTLCGEAAYAGGRTMLGSLLAMVTQPVIHARVDFLATLSCNDGDRRGLAREAERAIARALNLPAPSTRAGTAADRGV